MAASLEVQCMWCTMVLVFLERSLNSTAFWPIVSLAAGHVSGSGECAGVSYIVWFQLKRPVLCKEYRTQALLYHVRLGRCTGLYISLNETKTGNCNFSVTRSCICNNRQNMPSFITGPPPFMVKKKTKKSVKLKNKCGELKIITLRRLVCSMPPNGLSIYLIFVVG